MLHLLALLASPAIVVPKHPNLIVNGDFTAGNQGFRSDYAFDAKGVGEDGSYTIASNPNSVHSGGASFGDHTTGDGLMMVINGSQKAKAVIWESTVNVQPGHSYYFGLWAASWGEGGPSGDTYTSDPSPARLVLLVNGVPLGPATTLTARDGVWSKLALPWSSGNAKTAKLQVIDENTEWMGNDFAIDDIVFHD